MSGLQDCGGDCQGPGCTGSAHVLPTDQGEAVESLAARVEALVYAYDGAAARLSPHSSPASRARRAVYLRCRDDLRAALPATVEEAGE